METLSDFASTACLFFVGIFTINRGLVTKPLVTAVRSQQLDCLYPARVWFQEAINSSHSWPLSGQTHTKGRAQSWFLLDLISSEFWWPFNGCCDELKCPEMETFSPRPNQNVYQQLFSHLWNCSCCPSLSPCCLLPTEGRWEWVRQHGWKYRALTYASVTCLKHLLSGKQLSVLMRSL